jgi:hypothetical protein
MNEQILREVHRAIDRHSDPLFQAAVWFVEQHSLPTPNQTNGLLNIVQCQDNIKGLTDFLQHQAGKSTTRDSVFWSDLKREIEGLRKQAEEIQLQLDLNPENKKIQREHRDEISLLLARDYVQHLVAHVLYRSTLPRGE